MLATEVIQRHPLPGMHSLLPTNTDVGISDQELVLTILSNTHRTPPPKFTANDGLVLHESLHSLC